MHNSLSVFLFSKVYDYGQLLSFYSFIHRGNVGIYCDISSIPFYPFSVDWEIESKSHAIHSAVFYVRTAYIMPSGIFFRWQGGAYIMPLRSPFPYVDAACDRILFWLGMVAAANPHLNNTSKKMLFWYYSLYFRYYSDKVGVVLLTAGGNGI